MLTDEQKKTRVTMAKKLLKMYQIYSKKAYDNIVTGDETWVYHFEPKRKVANRIRATIKARRPNIAKQIRTVKRVLNAKIEELLQKSPPPKQDLSMSDDFCMIMHPPTRHVL